MNKIPMLDNSHYNLENFFDKDLDLYLNPNYKSPSKEKINEKKISKANEIHQLGTKQIQSHHIDYKPLHSQPYKVCFPNQLTHSLPEPISKFFCDVNVVYKSQNNIINNKPSCYDSEGELNNQSSPFFPTSKITSINKNVNTQKKVSDTYEVKKNSKINSLDTHTKWDSEKIESFINNIYLNFSGNIKYVNKHKNNIKVILSHMHDHTLSELAPLCTIGISGVHSLIKRFQIPYSSKHSKRKHNFKVYKETKSE